MKSSISKFIVGSSVAATLALLLTVPAPARAKQGAPARMNQVQRQQQAQIHQGIKNGQLNKQQAAHLVKGEKDVKATIAKDKANGPLTGAEAAQIKNETQHENAGIKTAEDGKTSPPTPQQ
ncbi:MAG TPA: hypothetical protein VIX19_20405 [Terriglobales bacterium]